MRKLRRIVAMPLLVAALVWGAPTPAGAVDNVALAINTKDETYLWRQAFKITRVNDDTADEKNVAWAEASCSHCRTAAVAFQIVLITGNASTITPANIVVAKNLLCSFCATYAGGFQVVLTTDEQQVHFTEAGNERIDQIREDLKVLLAGATFGPTDPEDDPLDITEIQAFDGEVIALFDQLKAVLATELVKVGGGRLTTIQDVDIAV